MFECVRKNSVRKDLAEMVVLILIRYSSRKLVSRIQVGIPGCILPMVPSMSTFALSGCL